MTITDPHARVQLLETLLVMQAHTPATSPATAVQAYTRRLLAEGLVSPGDLMAMHQRAHATAAAVRELAAA